MTIPTEYPINLASTALVVAVAASPGVGLGSSPRPRDPPNAAPDGDQGGPKGCDHVALTDGQQLDGTIGKDGFLWVYLVLYGFIRICIRGQERTTGKWE